MFGERSIDLTNVWQGLFTGLSLPRGFRQESVSLHKNRFSDPAICWRPISNKDTYSAIKQIVEKLDLGCISEVEASGEPAIASENYRVLLGGNKRVLIKRCSAGESEEFLSALHHTIEFIRDNGIKAPALMPVDRQNGRVAAEINGERWLAYEFVPAFSHFMGREKNVYQAAFQIGHFDKVLIKYAQEFPEIVSKHYKASGWEGAGLQNPKLLYLLWQGIRRAVKRSAEDDKNIKLLNSCKVSIHETLKSYADIFPELQFIGDKKQIIHNDIHPHNILMDIRSGAWLIDLHLMSERSIYTEIGWAFYQIVKHAALDTCDQYGNISKKDLKKLGKAFRKGYCTGNPGIEWNTDMIYGYALNESLALLFHHLNNIYIQGNRRWEFDLARHLHDIKDIQIIMREGLFPC